MAIRRRRSVSEIIDGYFTDLEEWVQTFRDTLTERPSFNLRNCSIEPLRDVIITSSEVLVTVDLPFTSKSGVKVEQVGSNSIEISAKMNRQIKLDDLGVTHCKGVFQKYHCHLRIPVPVLTKKMKMHYKRGMLEIHLPRKN